MCPPCAPSTECECGNILDHNARKGMCSPCYRKELYKVKDKEARNAYLRQRRSEGKDKRSEQAHQKRLAGQRARRKASPEKQRAEKFARRSTLGKIDKDYISILLSDPCSYCNGIATTIDHIVPLAEGGTNDWWNMTAACRPCNSGKHTRSLLNFMFRSFDR